MQNKAQGAGRMAQGMESLFPCALRLEPKAWFLLRVFS